MGRWLFKNTDNSDTSNVGGTGGGGTSHFGETLTGTQNGINQIFTTTTNFVAGTTQLYYDMLRLTRGVDYTETAPNQINFLFVPATAATIRIDFLS